MTFFSATSAAGWPAGSRARKASIGPTPFERKTPLVPSPAFIRADPVLHREALLEINIEYVGWVLGQVEQQFGVGPQALIGMSVPEYVHSALDKICGEGPPRGAFYLLQLEGPSGPQWAGMGGLRWLADGVAELKRVYVRPAFRGRQFGEALLSRVLADAQAFGYRRMVLDSAPFMRSAQRLYAAAGFVDRGPYEGVEVPPSMHAVWRFMERPI